VNRKYRKTVIAGNWKMNMLPSLVKGFAAEVAPAAQAAKWCETVVCVPYVMIPAAVRAFKGARIAVGAQNVSDKEKGAYTGEVSAAMLADLGVKYVIVGHSERRGYFGESDALVNAKAKAVLAAGMRPIICVGESLEQREGGVTLEFVSMQVKLALQGLAPEQIRKAVIAYEPIWAIGTGKTATAEQAGEVCSAIRAVIKGLAGARIAREVTIQYGGSMNPGNAAQLLAQPDVDGGLIGGASIVPRDFEAIIAAADQ